MTLHYMLEISLGWEGSHLYAFNIDGRVYGPPDPEAPHRIVDGKKALLCRVVRPGVTEFAYTNCCATGRAHRVFVEALAADREPGPRCLDGSGSLEERRGTIPQAAFAGASSVLSRAEVQEINRRLSCVRL